MKNSQKIPEEAKNSDHPIQQVRLACKMSQSTFGGEIGYSESYINAVESRDKDSSQEMRGRIYQRFGALILSDNIPAQALARTGENLELYTDASFEEHKRSYKPGWEAFLSEDVIEVFKLLPEAALAKARTTGDQGLVLAVRLHMQAEAQDIIKKFGLREQVRDKIRELQDSALERLTLAFDIAFVSFFFDEFR